MARGCLHLEDRYSVVWRYEHVLGRTRGLVILTLEIEGYGVPAAASVMHEEHVWFRERGYVLWGWDRMQ